MGWVASRAAASTSFCCGVELAFGVDDFGAAFAFGLGLLGHGAEHGLGQVDLLDLDGDDFYAEGGGVAVDDGLDAWLRASRWARSWSRSTSPRTERRVVWANWEVWSI